MNGLTLRDTFDLNMSQNQENTHVESGVASLDVVNAFPFSCDPLLYFLNENGQIIYSVVGTSQISSCEMGAFDPVDGLKKQHSHIEFVLTKELVKDIAQIKKVMVEARFDSPNVSTGLSEPKQVQAHAFLSFKLRMKLNTKIVL